MAALYTWVRSKCLASTGETFNKTIAKHTSDRYKYCSIPNARSYGGESNFFRSAQWSSDGAVIITHNEDQCLRTFKVPTNPPPDGEPHQLQACHILTSPSPISAFAIHPDFDATNNETTFCLSSAAGEAILLRDAMPADAEEGASGKLMTSYHWTDTNNEAYLPVFNVAFQDAKRILVGGHRRIAIFDASHKKPILDVKAPSKEAFRYDPLRCDGYVGKVSALAPRYGPNFAGGTTDRRLLVGDTRAGIVQAVSLDPEDIAYYGGGVTSLEWSSCGTYLVLAERYSNGIQVWDSRVLTKPLSHLMKRRAETPQRLGIGLLSSGHDFSVHAGGLDGVVQVWHHVQNMQGYESAHDSLIKLHKDAITSTILSPQGDMMATCSGQRFPVDDAIIDFSSDSENITGSSDPGASGASDTSDAPDDSNTSGEAVGDHEECTVPVVSARCCGRRRIKDNSLKLWAVCRAEEEEEKGNID